MPVQKNPDFLLRLLEISRQLTSDVQTDSVLRRILDAAIEFTGAERGFICLFNNGKLEIAQARNLDQEEVIDAQRKLSQSIVAQVIASGEPLVSMDAGEDDRLAEAKSIHKMRIRSVACIPLTLRPSGISDSATDAVRIIGCVYLDHRFQPAQFLDDDLELLQVFGAHAALAVKNANLVSQLEEKNVQLNDRLVDSAAQLLETESLLKDALADAKERIDVPGIVYASRAMHKVLGLVVRVADQDLPILIGGESGTGKELLARAVHLLSRRARGAFVPVNCGAISPELFESELFGHRRGAFTGADRDREGLVEAANGGTLFLDEVSELPLQHQVKLLRVLQEGEVRRVGESSSRKVDFRVLSACNKDLDEEVREGRFREDLYYRLRVFQVELPPLRNRSEDIPLLVDRFISKHKRIIEGGGHRETDDSATIDVAPDVYGLLGNYHWPGNIRELENEVKRALALCDGQITSADLSPHISSSPKRADNWAGLRSSGRSLEEILSVVEREVIKETLDKFGGNKSKTAQQLGISRNGLAMKMARLGLD